MYPCIKLYNLQVLKLICRFDRKVVLLSNNRNFEKFSKYLTEKEMLKIFKQRLFPNKSIPFSGLQINY